MGKVKMLGALAGDIIGSVYEFCNTKSTDFDLLCDSSNFTDDSVMTLAVAKWLVEDEAHTIHYLIYCMQELGDYHPNAGYGGSFAGWLCEDNPQPYNSWGNGAGMRVSPVGLYAKTLDEALALAALTASVSHNHPEGVKGAQAIATSVFLCKHGKSKQEIKNYVESTFGYNLHRTIAEIRPRYGFKISCQDSVPEAIIAFMEGNSFEEVIRLAISLGGDSDTIACMAGAIAACMYPIPDEIAERCNNILTDDLREIKDRFVNMFPQRTGKWRKIKNKIHDLLDSSSHETNEVIKDKTAIMSYIAAKRLLYQEPFPEQKTEIMWTMGDDGELAISTTANNHDTTQERAAEEDIYELSRFLRAQEYEWGGYKDALQEVKDGCKRKHWIWYIFPQINGLGHSDYQEFYGIKSLEEACAYLKNKTLGTRLREISETLLKLEDTTTLEIFGTTDSMKVKSCMTLFDIVSPHDIFEEVLEKYYDGNRCKLTLQRFEKR